MPARRLSASFPWGPRENRNEARSPSAEFWFSRVTPHERLIRPNQRRAVRPKDGLMGGAGRCTDGRPR